MVVKIEEKVVITNSSEAKNLNENEYFTAYFNDVKYGMTDYYEDLVSLGEWRKKAAVVCAEFVGKSC